jgi:hypothetical protein
LEEEDPESGVYRRCCRQHREESEHYSQVTPAGLWGVKNTIHSMLKEDLNLSKKSARWLPKLLTEEMKKERVQTSEAFLAMICRYSKAMLENMVMMDESAVSFHTPETKQQSKQ